MNALQYVYTYIPRILCNTHTLYAFDKLPKLLHNRYASNQN